MAWLGDQGIDMTTGVAPGSRPASPARADGPDFAAFVRKYFEKYGSPPTVKVIQQKFHLRSPREFYEKHPGGLEEVCQLAKVQLPKERLDRVRPALTAKAELDRADQELLQGAVELQRILGERTPQDALKAAFNLLLKVTQYVHIYRVKGPEQLITMFEDKFSTLEKRQTVLETIQANLQRGLANLQQSLTILQQAPSAASFETRLSTLEKRLDGLEASQASIQQRVQKDLADLHQDFDKIPLPWEIQCPKCKTHGLFRFCLKCGNCRYTVEPSVTLKAYDS